jgi:large subunit ribosomal protein L6e
MPSKSGKPKTARATRYTISKWYPGDDVKKHFKRANKAPKPTKLRRNIAPGQVLIVLAGRFKGKRVVFLKQLKSGLLLVTGPHKINGVPLKRLNQVYAIPTKTKVDLAGVNVNEINDDYFAKTKVKKAAKTEQAFFAVNQTEKSKEEQDRITKKKETQATVDKALLASIKKVDLLKQYLSSRFTLSKNTRPHELIF